MMSEWWDSLERKKTRAIERFFKSSDNGVIWLCNCRRPKQITRLIDVRHYFNQYQTDRTAVSLFSVSYPEYIEGKERKERRNTRKKEKKKEDSRKQERKRERKQEESSRRLMNT